MGPGESHKKLLETWNTFPERVDVQPEKRRLQGDLTVAFQYIKKVYKKDREVQIKCREEITYDKGGEMLELVAQRSYGCASLEVFKVTLYGALNSM